MNGYIELEHILLITSTPRVSSYYLPHQYAHKQDSGITNLRVVFDGSTKTPLGFPLNSIFHSGPTILVNTLLHFHFFVSQYRRDQHNTEIMPRALSAPLRSERPPLHSYYRKVVS